jgi:hypothetical protein
MPRRPQEQAVIDRFVEHLQQVTGLTWEPSPDEVSTRKNNRNPDCDFTSPGQKPIVADVCSLFPLGSDPRGQAMRSKFVERLLPELRREGVGGLMIDPPPIQKKHAHPDWPRRAAAAIGKAVRQLPIHQTVDVEDFTIKRIADNSEDSFFSHMSFSAYWPSDAAGHPLLALLRNKHEQIDVDGHQRILIVANDGCRTTALDVAAACALIAFTPYPNFDRIYFEESPGSFHLVYDRDAWIAMEAGRLPEPADTCTVVTQWLETRLRGNCRGALDTILRISWDRHSTDWLSEGGRATLELEAHLFLQACEWSTPRQFWELFRGPVPRIVDARRRSLVIPDKT